MFHPFSTPNNIYSDESYPFEGFSDNGEKPVQFISSDMQNGGVLDDQSRYSSCLNNDHQREGSYFWPGKRAPMCGLFNSLTPIENDLHRFLLFETLKLQQPNEEAVPVSFLSSGTEDCQRARYNRSGGNQNSNSIEKERSELSTEELVRVASALYIQSSSLIAGDATNLRLPFGLSLTTLGADELKSVELVGLLLAAAEKVNNEQYTRANALLSQCHMSSSKFGNAVQRIVYYFSDALQERIDRETGKQLSGGQKEKGSVRHQNVKAMLTNHPVHLVVNNTLPFTQVLQFTAMQALLDNVATEKRIHMIDLSIKYGQQWVIFLQGLATRQTCPLESLKISALGESEDLIAMTGKSLSSFAESMNLPFKFNPVIAPNMEELRETMFELEEGEAVGVFTSLAMNNLIVKPDSLENLMRVLRKLKPGVVAVIDVEANHNSRLFINRFTEALFFYSAYFDSLDTLLEERDENRLMIEGCLSQGIKSIIACESSERVVRHVGISVWRAFFKRFGLREANLSRWSMYQAQLVVKQYVKDSSCTLQMNSKALLIGWKGTPLHFVSAFKFLHEEEEEVSMASQYFV